MRSLIKIATIILLSCIIIQANSQTKLGFFLGPNYSFYKTGRNPSCNPGLGFQGGLSLKTNTNHTVSFRMDLFYSFITTNATIRLIAQDNPYDTKLIDARYIFQSIHINPQLQFNFLQNKSLFLTIGLGPRTSTATGKGEETSYSGITKEFKGRKYDFIFFSPLLSASLGIGYQNIKFGPLSGFTEISSSFDVTPFTDFMNYVSAWRAFTLSINIGFYIVVANKPAASMRDAYGKNSNKLK